MIHEAPSSPPKDAWEEVTRDLALLEKYKEFSEELLKVSIAVVAVLGFFFDKVAGASYFEIQDRKSIALHLVIAASLFVGLTCPPLALPA